MPKRSNRDIVEDSARFSLSELLEAGAFKKPISFSWNTEVTSKWQGLLAKTKWTLNVKNKKHLSEDNYLQYEMITAKGRKYTGRHLIETQPVHFGGYRYYFNCTCFNRAVFCGRRVKDLYFGGSVWACRHCLELVYTNCRYNRSVFRKKYSADNLKKKADKLRKNKHPRKANLIETKSLVLQHQQDIEMSEYIKKRYGHCNCFL